LKIPSHTLDACATLIRPFDPDTAASLPALLSGGGTSPIPKKYITIAEAAALLDVEPRTIVNFFHRGWLRRIPLGKRLARVAVEDIDKFMTSRVKP